MSDVKQCVKCNRELDVHLFICPHCQEPQRRGSPGFVTKKPTSLAIIGNAPTNRNTVMAPTGDGSTRKKVHVAVATFNDRVRVVQNLAPVEQVGPIEIRPNGNTNGAAALQKAEDILYGDPARIFRKSAVILLSDGEFNSGGNFLGIGGDASDAAIEASKSLQAKGARVGTILFEGEESARETLLNVASSRSLHMDADNGQLVRAMLSLTRTMTTAAGTVSEATVPGIAVVFLLDASGSMSEGGKKPEAEAAFLRCLEDLRKI